jgi:hypothetical protein
MNKESNEKIFGYKHLHYIFDPVFRVKDDNLFYKDRLIRWEDIEHVKIKEGVSSYYGFGPQSLLRGPRTILILRSGEEISILCDLTAKTTEIHFRLSQLSDSYKWLRDYVLRHFPDKPVGRIIKE